VQRRGHLERINQTKAELSGRAARGAALAQDSETLGLLQDMRADLVAEMRQANQEP